MNDILCGYKGDRESALMSYLYDENTPDERAQFSYDASTIDWWDYWINVHIPALRKWSYPLIEGRPIEKDENRVKRAFQMPASTLKPEQSLATK